MILLCIWDLVLFFKFSMHFPLFLIVITIVSLISTSLFYGNHRKLIRSELFHEILPELPLSKSTIASAHKLPLLSSARRRFSYTTPSSPVAAIISNPFTLAPLAFSLSLLTCSLFVPS